jgi:hypothetical protein
VGDGIYSKKTKARHVAHACNSNTQETEAGVPQIPGLLGLNRVPGQPEKDGGAERR